MRVRAKPVFAHHDKEELAEALAALRSAAAAPSDASGFDADDIRPIPDPVEAVAWVGKREAVVAEWKAEHDTEADKGAAKAVRLTSEELGWLSGFLVSRQVPPGTMTFEMFDAF